MIFKTYEEMTNFLEDNGARDLRKAASDLLTRYENNEETSRGRFYTLELNTIITIDNITGDCWIEEFSNDEAGRFKAVKWLLDVKSEDDKLLMYTVWVDVMKYDEVKRTYDGLSYETLEEAYEDINMSKWDEASELKKAIENGRILKEYSDYSIFSNLYDDEKTGAYIDHASVYDIPFFTSDKERGLYKDVRDLLDDIYYNCYYEFMDERMLEEVKNNIYVKRLLEYIEKNDGVLTSYNLEDLEEMIYNLYEYIRDLEEA